MSLAPPLISVVIPCFNAEATIRETVGSALDQDVPLEIIAIDDGSQDKTREILESFGPRITAIYGPNRGVSAARNSGIERATGKWVQFIDSDDLLYHGTLGRRLNCVGDDHNMVLCDWEDFSGDGFHRTILAKRKLDWSFVRENQELAFATTQWAPPAAVMYRRDIVDRVGGFSSDLPIIQDARFLFDAAYCGAKICHADHTGAGYRVVEGSLSRRNPGRFSRDLLINGQQIEALWQARGPLDQEQRHALAGIYDNASRGLFSAEDPLALVAASECRRLGGSSVYARVAPLLSQLIGLPRARRLLARMGKA